MNEFKKVLFIINKYSGAGYQPAVEGRIVNTCIEYDAECSIEFTQGRGHAIELARQGIGHFDLIVAVGGDGTINEVAQGLIHQPVHMGIIPRGSGNGLARHLGIPLNVAGAAKTLFTGTAVMMDSLKVNNRLSLNVSGIGFDGHIADQFGKNGKRGLINYARLALREYNHFNEFEVSMSIDNAAPINCTAFMLAFANSSQYGNNARIAPHASVTDQKLNICLVHKIPLYRLDVVYSLFKGKVDHTSFCTIQEGSTASVRLSAPVAYHVDGEPCGMTDSITVSMAPASLSMITGKTNAI